MKREEGRGSHPPDRWDETERVQGVEGAAEVVPGLGEGAVDPEKVRRRRRGGVWTLLEIVLIVAVAFGIAMLVQAFILKPFTVHQESMEPTLLEGDRILLSRLTYHFRDPKVGDVVVFHSPLTEDEDLVKRVVAVAGDVVAVKDGDLYVNGVPLVEPYLHDQDFVGGLGEQMVPAGHVFVMGDNRNVSGDSRMFGPISMDRIIGEALCTYWPIRRWRGL